MQDIKNHNIIVATQWRNYNRQLCAKTMQNNRSQTILDVELGLKWTQHQPSPISNAASVFNKNAYYIEFTHNRTSKHRAR